MTGKEESSRRSYKLKKKRRGKQDVLLLCREYM